MTCTKNHISSAMLKTCIMELLKLCLWCALPIVFSLVLSFNGHRAQALCWVAHGTSEEKSTLAALPFVNFLFWPLSSAEDGNAVTVAGLIHKPANWLACHRFDNLLAALLVPKSFRFAAPKSENIQRDRTKTILWVCSSSKTSILSISSSKDLQAMLRPASL